MTATIFARLHEALNRPQPAGLSLMVTLEDARELDARIRDMCLAERTCTICEARLCAECGIGEPVTCLEFREDSHCDTCRDECAGCQDAAGGEWAGTAETWRDQ